MVSIRSNRTVTKKRIIELGGEVYSFLTSWKWFLPPSFSCAFVGDVRVSGVCVCVGVHVCNVHVETESWCQESLSIPLPPCSFAAGSLNQTQSWQVPLPWSFAAGSLKQTQSWKIPLAAVSACSRVPCVCHTVLKLQKNHHIHQAFIWVLEIWTPVVLLMR